MMANTTEIVCTRCCRSGHYAKDCAVLPFFKQPAADRRVAAAKKKAEWEARMVEAAKKKAEWEARKAEREKKAAEWEARRSEREKKAAEREARLAEKNSKAPLKELDVQSMADSEASTFASTAVDEKEVEQRVMMDKQVRKLMKLLREVEKLEGRSDLDALQIAKLARKKEVEQRVMMDKQ